MKVKYNNKTDQIECLSDMCTGECMHYDSCVELDKMAAFTIKAVIEHSCRPKTKIKNLCGNCSLVRGLKRIECERCGREVTTYANGMDLCERCVEDLEICVICGRAMDEDSK